MSSPRIMAVPGGNPPQGQPGGRLLRVHLQPTRSHSTSQEEEMPRLYYDNTDGWQYRIGVWHNVAR